MEWWGMGGIDLAQDRDRWWVFLDVITFGLHKMQEISWIADLLASQKELCLMELVM
jgi:hypothetical protein